MNDFEKIYNDYFKLVYKYLLFLTNNADISEDLAQETFYKAITKIHTFKNKSKISTWLCQIAKNLLLNEVRHNKKIDIIPLSDNENLKNYYIVEDYIILNDEKRKLYNEIEKLDKTTRLVILYRIHGNLSFKEIGDLFNKSENWARTTFFRGKENLKEGLL
jgi:RNA polymerase sigma factor (sigma-70 family)